MYDGAFRVIRFNPRATVGSAVLVAAIAMSLPVLLTAVLTFAVDLTSDGSSDLSTGEALAVLGTSGSLLIGTPAAGDRAAARHRHGRPRRRRGGGRPPLSLGEAWAATRGSRWRLVGLALLLGLMAFRHARGLHVALWVVVVLVAPTVVIVLFGLVTRAGVHRPAASGGGSGSTLPARAGLMIRRTGVWRRSGGLPSTHPAPVLHPSASNC